MTSSLTLNVEREELLARADELAAPLPDLPSEAPIPPCVLAVAQTVVQQITLSADTIRLYLQVGERERQRLAQSLRNVAKAYEEVDEGAAQGLATGEGSVSPVTAGPVDPAPDPSTLPDTPVAAASDNSDFTEVKRAAFEFVAGDQGASLNSFSNQWTAYQRALLEATYRFRPFDHWDGDATAAFEAAFDQHRSWLYQMADQCATMARQAQDVVAAHRWALPEHPSLAAVVKQEEFWQEVQSLPAIIRDDRRGLVKALLANFATLQAKSEEVLAEYAKKAAVAPVSPPKPPPAIRIAEPPPQSDPGPTPDPGPVPDPQPEPDWSFDQLPSGLGSGGIPTGGMPIGEDPPALKDMLADALNPTAGSGLKPASLGGSGIGAALPSGPLKPPYFPEPSPSPSANGAAAPGRGLSGAGAAMGGGGMGMAPMGPGARRQGENNKGKRTEETEESLYTEQRPWTEGVIGIHKKVDSIRADSLRADALEADLLGLMR